MTMYEWGDKRTGVFCPQRMETLRPGMESMIGRRFEFAYAWTAEDGETYAGQTVWIPSRKHDPELTDDQRGRWVPEEDIEFEGE